MMRNGIRRMIAAVCAPSLPQASAESSGLEPSSVTPAGVLVAVRKSGMAAAASTPAKTVEDTRYLAISVGCSSGNTLLTAEADRVPWPAPRAALLVAQAVG